MRRTFGHGTNFSWKTWFLILIQKNQNFGRISPVIDAIFRQHSSYIHWNASYNQVHTYMTIRFTHISGSHIHHNQFHIWHTHYYQFTIQHMQVHTDLPKVTIKWRKSQAEASFASCAHCWARGVKFFASCTHRRAVKWHHRNLFSGLLLLLALGCYLHINICFPAGSNN